MRNLKVLALAIAVAGFVAVVAATTTHMAALPSSATLGCANCHTGATTTTAPADGPLNAFGEAFRDNGMVWNAALAHLDSDGDDCENGLEIGDADGNGVPDGNQTAQTSSPGVGGDCQPNTMDEQTWGALKNLFNTN